MFTKLEFTIIAVAMLIIGPVSFWAVDIIEFSSVIPEVVFASVCLTISGIIWLGLVVIIIDRIKEI